MIGFMNAVRFVYIIIIVILSAGGSGACGQSQDHQEPPLVGAIRWDGWVGPLNKAGLEVEYTLGPYRYHYRAPFYSKVIGRDSIQCRGTSRQIMDQEIAYASYSGIRYWAFCWYPSGSGLDTARELYLASTHKQGINWCIILGTNPFDEDRDGAWLAGQFKTTCYQKVLDGRPLVFVFPSPDMKKSLISHLRMLSREAGLADPYVVAMAFSARDADSICGVLGADAVSCYASAYNFTTGGQYDQAKYATVVPGSDRAGWTQYEATGRKIVPWVTAGWSPKPRIERSVSWGAYYKPNGWTQDGTPEEIADHVRGAVHWASQHENSAEANTVLIYAWNEFDEGGWICPTLGDRGARIRAIRRILKSRK